MYARVEIYAHKCVRVPMHQG